MLPKKYKYLSGSEKRKKRKLDEQLKQSQKGAMNKFVRPIGSSNEKSDEHDGEHQNNVEIEHQNKFVFNDKETLFEIAFVTY